MPSEDCIVFYVFIFKQLDFEQQKFELRSSLHTFNAHIRLLHLWSISVIWYWM